MPNPWVSLRHNQLIPSKQGGEPETIGKMGMEEEEESIKFVTALQEFFAHGYIPVY
jgi:hypothetical protein